jgi:hypothetical protein
LTMISERRLVSETERYFQDMKFTTVREVPLFENRIDLVIYNRRLTSIIAVEVKVDKWFRALQQAVLYRMCADKVYVALSEEFVHRVDMPLMEKYGVGLLSVNGSLNEILPPDPSRYIMHQKARDCVRRSLMEARRWGHVKEG